MQKKAIVMVFTLLVLGLILFGCKLQDDDEEIAISLIEDNFTLKPGKKEDVFPLITGAKEDLEVWFFSDNPDVATVNNIGIITAVSPGNAIITVTLKDYPDIYKTVSVMVLQDDTSTESLYINGPDFMTIGTTVRLTGPDEPDLEWQSATTLILEVDENGLVSGLEVGVGKVRLVSHETGDYAEKEITVLTPFTVEGPRLVLLNGTVQLTTSRENKVDWESSDTSVLQVDSNGIVTGIKSGVGFIRAISRETGEIMEKEITVVTDATPQSLEIEGINERVTYSSDITLKALIAPEYIQMDVLWESSDEDVCTVDTFGVLTVRGPGEVTIKATLCDDETVEGRITIVAEPTLIELLEHYQNKDVQVQNIKTYGATTKDHLLIGSVNCYLIYDLNIIESLVEAGRANRPADVITNVKYITFHDTGNNNRGANARSHDSYIRGSAASALVSWHYTVGNDGIYHHIPNNESAMHAGDSRLYPYKSFDSGVSYTNKKKPAVTISSDGYFVLDGIRSQVAAPRNPNTNAVPVTANINDQGIEVTKGDNGNWFIGLTYWNTYFNKISNRGGNLNSIAIESCVDEGSDIFLTWQMAAKLIAKLLLEYDLTVDHVQQHHYFAGKDCPMTMRHSNNYPMFLRMIECEYYIRKFFSDYTISYTSNNPTYLDNRGRVIKLPTVETTVTYKVEVKNNLNNEVDSKVFSAVIPAQ